MKMKRLDFTCPVYGHMAMLYTPRTGFYGVYPSSPLEIKRHLAPWLCQRDCYAVVAMGATQFPRPRTGRIRDVRVAAPHIGRSKRNRLLTRKAWKVSVASLYGLLNAWSPPISDEYELRIALVDPTCPDNRIPPVGWPRQLPRVKASVFFSLYDDSILNFWVASAGMANGFLTSSLSHFLRNALEGDPAYVPASEDYLCAASRLRMADVRPLAGKLFAVITRPDEPIVYLNARTLSVGHDRALRFNYCPTCAEGASWWSWPADAQWHQAKVRPSG